MNRGVSQGLGLGLGLVATLLAVASCGGSERSDCTADQLLIDDENCGVCGNVCDDNYQCVEGFCLENACNPATVEECYSGGDATLGVGLCAAGTRTCTNDGTWGECVNEVLPSQEVCGNGVDENCNGTSDEDQDLDEDGYTTCDGDCADNNDLINPGAFEFNGNAVDDDCDGATDNALAGCDNGIPSDTSDFLDYARAMDLCQTSSVTSRRWGVLDAKFSLADGSPNDPAPAQRAVRDGFGTAMVPLRGSSVAVLSSGAAADQTDTNPPYSGGISLQHNTLSTFPADWLAANGGELPNAPGCPAPSTVGQCGVGGCDPVMLTLTIRVPSNAKSFSVKTNFMSYEFPEYVCTQFNDQFVMLLDSTWAEDPQNPTDKNLAFYSDPITMERTPVGINLAHNNTGLFTMCMNGNGGCNGPSPFEITSCLDATLMAGTGFDIPESACGTSNLRGGGTGWLTTSGNVVGGEIIKLRIAIWDTSDGAFDSTVVIDDFQWSVDSAEPGTVIE
jgi:hypothetical protein